MGWGGYGVALAEKSHSSSQHNSFKYPAFFQISQCRDQDIWKIKVRTGKEKNWCFKSSWYLTGMTNSDSMQIWVPCWRWRKEMETNLMQCICNRENNFLMYSQSLLYFSLAKSSLELQIIDLRDFWTSVSLSPVSTAWVIRTVANNRGLLILSPFIYKPKHFLSIYSISYSWFPRYLVDTSLILIIL